MIILRAHHLQAVIFTTESFHQLHIFWCFVVAALHQFAVELRHMITKFVEMRKGFFHFCHHRGVIAEHHHLWQIAHAHLTLHRHSPVCGLLQTGYDFEHRAFASTVLADQCNAVALVHHKTHIFEESFGGKFYFEVFY